MNIFNDKAMQSAEAVFDVDSKELCNIRKAIS